MCVAVTLKPGAELTPEEVFRMGMANGDGFGFAWAEDGVVHWWKTTVYDHEYLTNLINSMKDFPRFVHFRLSTVGGVRADLCHPFEIGPLAACQPKGHANKVMMHNGHWFRAGEIHDILKKEGGLPDNGPWSDTRIGALMASYDEDWLTVITGKVATMDGDGNMKLIGSWDKLRDGIMVSNKSWDHEFTYQRTGSGRKWEGWGWTEQSWKNKEAHDKVKAEKEKEEKEKKEKESNGKKTEAKEGADSGDEHNDTSGGNLGVRQRNRQLPSGRAHGPGEQGAEREKAKYDLTPWRNPSTGEWWQVDPVAAIQGTCRVRAISESEAMQIMEQAATTPGKA